MDDHRPQPSSASLVRGLAEISGVRAAAVFGRDGFTLDAAGHVAALDLDALGATIARLMLDADRLSALFGAGETRAAAVEFAGGCVAARPLGRALLALVCPDRPAALAADAQATELLARLERFF